MAKKQALKRPVVKKIISEAGRGRSREPWSAYDEWILWFGFAILIAVPLLFSRYSYDQFDLIKLATLRLLVLGMVVAWIAKLLGTREPINWSWREGLLAAFLLVALISTFTSIHIPTSLHGKYKRYEGLLTFITYITMYFAFSQSFKEKKRLQLLIEIVSMTGAVVAFYGVLQFIGLDPVNWGKVPFEERRSFSTFGNPDLLAGYLVLAFPCSIAAYFHEHKRAWLHGAAAFILASGLLTALTRGGWLGALVGAVCLLIFTGKRLKNYGKKAVFLVPPLVVVLLAIVAYSSATHLDIVAKFRGAFEFNSGTALSRFEIWKAGWLMVKDRPLFGQGLDTYRLASEHFETLRYVQSVAGGTVSDNAHNYFVQLAAGGGPIAAFLIYGFFISWVVRMIKVRRGLVDENERLLLGGIIAAVIGYLATMLVGISIVGASSTFWLLLAAGTGFSRKVGPAYKSFDFSRLNQEVKVGAVAAMLVITIISAGFAVAMYASDISFVQALVAGARGDEAVSVANFNRAFRLYPGNGRIMSELGQRYMQSARMTAGQQDNKASVYYTQQAILAFQRAQAAEPAEVDYRVFLANTYGLAGQYEEASRILEGVLAQRPYSVPGHLLYGQFLSAEGRTAEAAKQYEAVLLVAPNQKDALAALVALHRKSGNEAKAEEYQERLEKITPARQ